MQKVAAVFTVLACVELLGACEKGPSTADPMASLSASAPAVQPPAPAASAAPSVAAPVASAEALANFDPCLVGSWKSTAISLQAEQVNARGGANMVLSIGPAGDASVDFGGMTPVQGKGGGADFDFKYAGKANATLATPTRGALTSSKADYSGLRVSANVTLPGMGKLPVLKDKSLSELTQMAAAVAGAKGSPSAAPPPGIDTSPVFSTTGYTCAGDTLTLRSEKPGAEWVFARAH